MTNGPAPPSGFAQLLRITLFPSSTLPGTDDLWHRLTGRDPEIDESRRTEALHRQAGPHGEGELEVRVQPIRIDLLMKALTSDVASPKLHLGSFDAEAEAFLRLARPWLGDIRGDIVRAAFGGMVLYRATDRAEAYGLLDRYVPSVKVDAEHTKEVQYRVNRPRESKQGITLNRITTWTPMAVKVDLSTLGSKAVRISEEHFLRLEFDHNTPAERTEPLEQEAIVPIFDELLEMATENALQGECP
jgi:hypothetical protein